MSLELEMTGLEFDWLAVDADGYVAVLSTAGGGFVPSTVESPELCEEAIDALLATAPSTTALQAPVVGKGCVNTWEQAAERGAYAFDGDFNRPDVYRRVAVPRSPIHVSALPAVTQTAAKLVRFESLRFASSPHLQRADLPLP